VARREDRIRLVPIVDRALGILMLLLLLLLMLLDEFMDGCGSVGCDLGRVWIKDGLDRLFGWSWQGVGVVFVCVLLFWLKEGEIS